MTDSLPELEKRTTATIANRGPMSVRAAWDFPQPVDCRFTQTKARSLRYAFATRRVMLEYSNHGEKTADDWVDT
jgi:hydroxyacyl-ACP dehydratase HTD2-like protein with hotdog domain